MLNTSFQINYLWISWQTVKKYIFKIIIWYANFRILVENPNLQNVQTNYFP